MLLNSERAGAVGGEFSAGAGAWYEVSEARGGSSFGALSRTAVGPPPGTRPKSLAPFLGGDSFGDASTISLAGAAGAAAGASSGVALEVFLERGAFTGGGSASVPEIAFFAIAFLAGAFFVVFFAAFFATTFFAAVLRAGGAAPSVAGSGSVSSLILLLIRDWVEVVCVGRWN